MLHLFFALVLLKFCESYIQIGCPTSDIDLQKTPDYVIRYNDSDFTNCRINFIVPMYYVPQIALMSIILNNDDKIIVRQFSEYARTKTFIKTSTSNNDDLFDLSPTNFTVEFNITPKTNESFVILIHSRDRTPAFQGPSFIIPQNLALLLDSDSISGNSSFSQNVQNSNDQYSIRVVVYNENGALYTLMHSVHIYDNGIFKGSIYDVLLAENSSQPCYGTNFTIVNSLSTSVGVFTILISPKYEWSGSVIVKSSPILNTTQLFSATDGITIFHEINSPYFGVYTPSIFNDIKFRGDGVLNIYAGCVNSAQESMRIATITSEQPSIYNNMMLYSRCRTYVLNRGVVQWVKTSIFPTDFKNTIGQKGVIMSSDYPLVRTDQDDLLRSFLIQAPDINTNIIVDYEIAHISNGTTVTVTRDIKANQAEDQSITSADNGKNITVGTSYQQYIKFRALNGTEGILIRYTVRNSASIFNSFHLIFLLLNLIY